MIMTAITPLSLNEDEMHDIGYTLLEIEEKNSISTLLAWVYENIPCITCRFSVVKFLVGSGEISFAMANECLYDVEDDIRKLVKPILGMLAEPNFPFHLG